MIQRKMGMVCGVAAACWMALCVSAAEPEVGPRLTDEQFFCADRHGTGGTCGREGGGGVRRLDGGETCVCATSAYADFALLDL